MDPTQDDISVHRTYLLRPIHEYEQSKPVVCGVLEYSEPNGVIEVSKDVYEDILF